MSETGIGRWLLSISSPGVHFGDDGAARSLERALDLAEPDGALLLFQLHPAPDLLRRHAR
jgi:LuxR family maltose regulon positive regulatory protein